MAQSGHTEAYRRMSAFGGKPDIDKGMVLCPLLTQNDLMLLIGALTCGSPSRSPDQSFCSPHPRLAITAVAVDEHQDHCAFEDKHDLARAHN